MEYDKDVADLLKIRSRVRWEIVRVNEKNRMG